MSVFVWLLHHKFLIFLIVASSAFCISTIVLSVQNKDLNDQLDEYETKNKTNNSGIGTTTTSTTTKAPSSVTNKTLPPVITTAKTIATTTAPDSVITTPEISSSEPPTTTTILSSTTLSEDTTTDSTITTSSVSETAPASATTESYTSTETVTSTPETSEASTLPSTTTEVSTSTLEASTLTSTNTGSSDVTLGSSTSSYNTETSTDPTPETSTVTESTTDSLQTTATPDDEMSEDRLPSYIKPTHYDLTLKPDLETGNFSGNVQISFEILKASDSISLHSNQLDISSVQIDGEETNFELDTSHELLVVTRKDGTMFGARTSLFEIEFSGDMKNRIVGLYTSTYTSISGSKTTIATSKFEPTYARQAYPCFDEPNMKAEYTVHLLKPKDGKYIALSNYPVKETLPYDDNNELVTFEKTVSMSTYLTCFIVSDFIASNTTFDNAGISVPLQVFASPDNLEKTRYAGEMGKAAIEYYVKYFGIPYPLPKLDMVAIPDFVSGAMEHWGLVTYRETALLYTPETHSSSNKQRVATVVAHELAHSWFGNLVTMDWWNDLWLNEGFASYIEYKGVESHHPDWEMMTQFLTDDLHPVLSFDAAISSHPIVQTVTTPDQITAIFDTISYNKGASILRMLETTVGVSNFQKGVTNYLKKYAYKNAVTKNFLDEIQGVVGSMIDIYEMMDTYTVQTGYPVITVTGDVGSTKWTLTQKRFLTNPDAVYDQTEAKYGYKWTIPITYITDQGNKGFVMFNYNEDTKTIDVPSDARWIKLNIDQTGYYRVNYESWMYENLARNYLSLSVADRTHLLEEEFSLAESGMLLYDMPLNLTKQLEDETSYTPWKVARAKLAELLVRIRNQDALRQQFESYIRNLITPAYNSFSWAETDEDSHLKRLTRTVVLNLACEAGHEECLSEAEKQFDNWISSDQNLSQDLRGLVYKYGMKKADEDTWNALLEKYKAESDASEKLKLANGLASVENVELLERFIELAKDENIVRGQDFFTVLQYISANEHGTILVWTWVRNNWEYLVDRFTLNDRYLGSLIPAITSSFSTSERINEMNVFFQKYPEAGAGKTNRERALETAKNNLMWDVRYRSNIENWLKQFES